MDQEALKQILTRLKASGWPLTDSDLVPFPEKGEEEFSCLEDEDPFAGAWDEDDPFANLSATREQEHHHITTFAEELEELGKRTTR